MISPTGLGIRNDSMGGGEYGSLRSGGRKHKGTDFLCRPYREIVAPFNMVVKRVAYPYGPAEGYGGIAWMTKHMEGKMFYFEPHSYVIGETVSQGDSIGIAQDISDKYGRKMQPHIHFQIDKFDPQILMNLTKLAKVFS